MNDALLTKETILPRHETLITHPYIFSCIYVRLALVSQQLYDLSLVVQRRDVCRRSSLLQNNRSFTCEPLWEVILN